MPFFSCSGMTILGCDWFDSVDFSICTSEGQVAVISCDWESVYSRGKMFEEIPAHERFPTRIMTMTQTKLLQNDNRYWVRLRPSSMVTNPHGEPNKSGMMRFLKAGQVRNPAVYHRTRSLFVWGHSLWTNLLKRSPRRNQTQEDASSRHSLTRSLRC